MSHAPIPDRRHGVRIVTLKNFVLFLFVAMAMLVTAELVVRTRRPEPTDYGRIIDQQMPAETVAKQAPEVVTEGKIADQTAVDPLLVAPIERSQYLDLPVVPAPSQAGSIPTTTATGEAPQAIAAGARAAEGTAVAVVTSTAAAPLLSGGTFKERP
jgi:hypothetical protein